MIRTIVRPFSTNSLFSIEFVEIFKSFYKSEFLKVFHSKLNWFGIDPYEDESDFGIYCNNCSCNPEDDTFTCTCGWSDETTKSEHLAFQ